MNKKYILIISIIPVICLGLLGLQTRLSLDKCRGQIKTIFNLAEQVSDTTQILLDTTVEEKTTLFTFRDSPAFGYYTEVDTDTGAEDSSICYYKGEQIMIIDQPYIMKHTNMDHGVVRKLLTDMCFKMISILTIHHGG